MKMTTTGKQFIDEVEYGVYVWRMPDGKIVGDDQGNFLSINSMRGDIQKISMLTNAVKEFDVREGEPYFLSGHRKVTDEEYEEQKERFNDGLVPDEYDVPSVLEDLKFRNDR